ncbi:TIGR03745 family integrating conjugative element membrane protein [Pseudomonas sp. Snoq117.2]|uniref:TIGR03745 family integrating conjugative element membrane protein n=1 Tax=Pseudomonas sp. Snoq117.2 TaxID=1500302 RepID=UPI0007377100|nr:TIGR03745 family integrating conjugative element membrane protein [Pseudomonas sp. Snoq117.2]KTT64119.1 conjugal transfer protein [Pseudomonas psychrotolerans]SEP30017.1 integrating conjugative element membrane protein, PFL_4702 family [Pseudomonas sp. Snoq117.2]
MLSLKHLLTLGARAGTQAALASAALLPAISQAALPQAQAPSRGEGSTWLETLKNYGFDLISLFALAICAFCLIVVAAHGITVYHEIHVGKKTWKDLGVTITVGVVLIGLVIFIVTKATGIM